jgi:glycerol-3-phosphate acyltransferase PlsY
MDALFSLLAIVLAYLVGSLSFAVIVSRLMGLDDPRSYGSGNPGATNVLRSGSKKAAILTLLLDAVKGVVPVLVAQALAPTLHWGELTIGLVGLAAFLGHLWPVFFRFQGGKGVATAAGVILALHWPLGLAVLATWLAVAFVTRYSSLAALVAAVAAPLIQLLVWPPSGLALPLIAMSLLLIWRHGANIRKLMAGTESRIGQKAGAPVAAKPATSHAHEKPHRDHPHRHHSHSHSSKGKH